MDLLKTLAELDAEIAMLLEARALISGEPHKRKSGRPLTGIRPVAKKAPKKHRLSEEGRKRISDAVRARWAKRNL